MEIGFDLPCECPVLSSACRERDQWGRDKVEQKAGKELFFSSRQLELTPLPKDHSEAANSKILFNY